MAYGIKALRRISFGPETVGGTAVATTAVIRGTGTAEDLTEVQFADDDIGYLGEVGTSYIASQGSRIVIEQDATFQQIVYPLAAGVVTLTTGVTDTGGSGKVYTFTFPTTAPATVKTYTIEAGDNAGAEKATFCHCTGFKLTGKVGEALKMESTYEGRAWAPATATTNPAVPACEVIIMSKGTIALDTAGGTMGATVKSGTLLGIDLDVKTGNRGVITGDGRLDMTFLKTTRQEITCKVTFEHETAAVAEKAIWRSQALRKMRLLWTGAALTTQGTFTWSTLQVSLVGKWTKFDKLEDQDGDDVVTGTFKATYDTAAPVIVVVNETSPIV